MIRIAREKSISLMLLHLAHGKTSTRRADLHVLVLCRRGEVSFGEYLKATDDVRLGNRGTYTARQYLASSNSSTLNDLGMHVKQPAIRIHGNLIEAFK